MHFIKTDTSLLKNVDVACKEIATMESKINVLFMSAGYLTLKGRDGAQVHWLFSMQSADIVQKLSKGWTGSSA